MEVERKLQQNERRKSLTNSIKEKMSGEIELKFKQNNIDKEDDQLVKQFELQ